MPSACTSSKQGPSSTSEQCCVFLGLQFKSHKSDAWPRIIAFNDKRQPNPA
jgi:hypothetical protein